MADQKSQFRKLLEKQSTTLLKESLFALVEDYTGVKVNGTKKAMMRRIYFEMVEELQKLKIAGKTPQDLQNHITGFFHKYDLPLTVCKQATIRRVAWSYFEGQQPQQSKSLEKPLQKQPQAQQTIISSSRPARLIPSEVAPNIWHDSKRCICQQPSRTQNTVTEQEPCYQCGKMCHVDCMWPKENDELLECPFCYMRFCNPAREVQHVFFASYLFRKTRERV